MRVKSRKTSLIFHLQPDRLTCRVSHEQRDVQHGNV